MANRINMASIRNKIAASQPVLAAVEKIAKQTTLQATQIAELEFANHAVTKEIEAGTSGSNSSGTLGGYGNLFSFIGFPSNSNPVTVVKQLWKTVRFTGLKKIKVVGSFGRSYARYTFNVIVPSPDDFEQISPIPWRSGVSWLTAISKGGISGLGYYISKLGLGRSRGGLQLKKSLRAGKMQTTPYFMSIYNKFAKVFKNSKKFNYFTPKS